jgi:arylformamidase
LARGWSVALPGYTLAPDASLTEITCEIGAALDWLSNERSRQGISGPLILGGWSAGAHLAAMHLEHPMARLGLLVSGVYDLAPLRSTSINDKLRLTDAEIERLSPLAADRHIKPAIVAYGEKELPALVDDARRLHAQRVDAGADSALICVGGANHFTILDQFRTPDSALLNACAERL